ncbi:hypothetical protein [Longimicrobium terrae]|uniref:Uncharacterized protein n=1 Tax=Longimicrobium terrae TaxID=1639882 RepID=A0A841GVK8_9BACT|nr:hypothetical protein [Longimicrobium terrae]MBB4634225.1 hypothetical protein [Longimicrobium terrae]MBB6068885.1 hypothetical protein [Longimicrobium terrae]NNC28065.1 hypothetical protein [Longimicrobium terrae]
MNTAAAAFTVSLEFSAVRSAARLDLRLEFRERVFACMSHEEFVHPWQYEQHGPVPRLSPPWERYAFPVLKVHDSRWLASFSDSQILDVELPEVIHYRFVTLDHTADVLASGEVHASWVPVDR